ncbi:UDP-N-acetylmuramoylalanyl-D-glutamate--2,6-diaminopimelate ligase [Oceanospirillum multiglobuliferum]|nr:UDP-N-acetylmuramoyl-L-alanyl-D-glutamate--2,6-diaminopimelate ligase [Oceanospirillum multiglobuliferum]SJZ44955.1 UDP-N-acetylmuramoylalanyl-D-glutamate--2,6-diaminopimelate ligase [Oceanospirillum multiglobuliferum]
MQTHHINVMARKVLEQLSQCFPELPLALAGALDNKTFSLQLDSRLVQAGDLFIALRGSQQDGRNFISAAITKGASIVLVEADQDHFELQTFAEQQIPVIELKTLRSRLGAWLAASTGLGATHGSCLIGVTGTNGKTSVTHYLAQLLDAVQKPCAVIGTVGIGAIHQLQTASHTTPDLISLHAVLAKLQQDGFVYQAMEVSSHALDQQRIAGVPFSIAIFTNLSRDHLDYHGDMDSYGAAKLKLFQCTDLALSVLNLDDAFTATILEHQQAKNCVTYSLYNTEADLYCESVQALPEGFLLQLAGRWGEHALRLPLFGEFNIANVLAALAALLGSGFSLEQLLPIAAQLKPVAGRMQLLSQPDVAKVVIDYAHTPDALNNALQAVKAHLKGRLICVFGCGGDRDRGKRPLMAQAAEQHANQIWVTSDNPRTESPEQIVQEILSGFSPNSALLVHIEVDRALAIQQAITGAAVEDVVLIAGKGHENYQEIQSVRHYFDDVVCARVAQQATAEKIALSQSQKIGAHHVPT